MAKAAPTAGRSKTDIVRDYIRQNPDAPASQIVTDLRAYGISLATAQKTKYLEGLKRRGVGRNRGRGGAATARPSAAPATGTKADAIREVAEAMPKPIRPRDVVAALAGRGIHVTRTQVSQVLKKAGLRRRRGGRRPARTGTATVGRSSAGAVSQELSLEALLAAKKLANHLGSVGAAKQAVDALAKLS